MQEWKESSLTWYLESLASNDIQDVARALFVVGNLGTDSQPKPVPTGNTKVIKYLEQFVKDHRICIVDWRTPYTYGELRWLAARVLVCEYAYQGIEQPIVLKDVTQPIWSSEYAKSVLYHIVEQYRHQLVTPDKIIERLVESGFFPVEPEGQLLPTKTEIIKPQDYAYCCSKEAVEARRKQQQDKRE